MVIIYWIYQKNDKLTGMNEALKVDALDFKVTVILNPCDMNCWHIPTFVRLANAFNILHSFRIVCSKIFIPLENLFKSTLVYRENKVYSTEPDYISRQRLKEILNIIMNRCWQKRLCDYFLVTYVLRFFMQQTFYLHNLQTTLVLPCSLSFAACHPPCPSQTLPHRQSPLHTPGTCPEAETTGVWSYGRQAFHLCLDPTGQYNPHSEALAYATCLSLH